MTYEFLGEVRSSWFFATPNQYAIVLVMVACLLAASSVAILSRLEQRRSHPRFGTLLIALFTVIQAPVWYAIARTYSRGGYLAFVMAMVLMAIVASRQRKVLAGFGVCFVAVVLLIANGAARLKTMTPLGVDDSVANRFVLWKNTLALAWDRRWSGIDLDQFREYYSSWYQPIENNPVYLTAVSDYVTIAAGFGFPFLWWVLFCGSSLIVLGVVYYRRTKDYLVLGLAAACFAYAVGSAWSTFFRTIEVVAVPMSFGFLLVLLMFFGRRSLPGVVFAKGVVCGAAFASVGVLICAMVGRHVSASYGHMPFTLHLVDSPEVKSLFGCVPRHQESGSMVLFISDKISSEVISRSLFRDLSAAGIQVVEFRLSELGGPGIEAALEVYRCLRRHLGPAIEIFVAGQGEGATIALLVAAEAKEKPAGTIFVSGRSWSPFESLSPVARLRDIEGPLLIVYGDNDRVVDPEESRQLIEEAKRTGVALETLALPNADHRLSGQWPQVGNAIVGFTKNVLVRK